MVETLYTLGNITLSVLTPKPFLHPPLDMCYRNMTNMLPKFQALSSAVAINACAYSSSTFVERVARFSSVPASCVNALMSGGSSSRTCSKDS